MIRQFDAEDLGVLVANMAHDEGDDDTAFEERLERVIDAVVVGHPPEAGSRLTAIAREAARNRRRILAARGGLH